MMAAKQIIPGSISKGNRVKMRECFKPFWEDNKTLSPVAIFAPNETVKI